MTSSDGSPGLFRRRDVAVGTALAVLVNLFLFSVLPGLLASIPESQSQDTIEAISLIRFKPPQDRPDRKPEPPKPPEPKKTPPKPALGPAAPTPVPPTPMALDMPDLNFEVNARITGGVAVDMPASGVFDLSQVDQAPVAIFRIPPAYPFRAKRLQIEGEVSIRFLVDRLGKVSRIKILSASPEGYFEEATRKAVSGWKFNPAKLSGEAVATWVQTSVAFKLD